MRSSGTALTRSGEPAVRRARRVNPVNDAWLQELEVFCADIGSIAGGRFAWARRHASSDGEEVPRPSSIDSLARAVIFPLQRDRPTALGVEMPLFVPVP